MDTPPTNKSTMSIAPWIICLDDNPPAGNGLERDRSLAELGATRRRLHGCFERRDDALFDLTDPILTAGIVSSLAASSSHLQLAVSIKVLICDDDRG